MVQSNLLDVDWSKIPAPDDDGATAHLVARSHGFEMKLSDYPHLA